MNAGAAAKRGPRRPRPPVVMRASFVSDETCLALLGIVPRKFREVVVPRCEHVTRLGHTVAVELDEAERVMRVLGQASDDEGQALDPASEAHDEDDSEQPRSVDDVLRKLGKERVA